MNFTELQSVDASEPVLTPVGGRPAFIFSGSANDKLTNAICKELHMNPGKVEVKSFSDGETFVKINENVRGGEVFVVQSTSTPANENLMRMLLIIDALKRASALRICAVMPYYGYARQDRKEQGRVALSAKLVANLIVEAGADRVVSIDFHTGQIQGFFDIPVDHLYAGPVILDYVKKNCELRESVVVAADVGTVKRARAYAEALGLPLAFIDKRRPSANVSEVMNVVGEVKGKDCLIFDDMIDTAGTLCNAAQAVHELGASKILACATHPVLSGPAVERIAKSPIKRCIVTDTIPTEHIKLDKLELVSVAPLLAEAIARILSRKSVSSMFTEG